MTLADPAENHKRLCDPHTGRINPRNLKQPYPVDASALRALKRELLKRVGELAAGWNAGAQKLGVKLPAWVARHGSKRSSAAVLSTFRVFRIISTNSMRVEERGSLRLSHPVGHQHPRREDAAARGVPVRAGHEVVHLRL